MTLNFYKPENSVSGPAYNLSFKLLATVVTVVLAVYAADVALRFPLPDDSFGVKTVLSCAALLLALSYYWFLRSTITIDDTGITQTWLYNRHVEWREIRGAKMIGIPAMSWLFPPRLIVRTGNSFMSFNGGSQPVLIEFAKISLAYQIKK
jgi:hypothetical protein